MNKENKEEKIPHELTEKCDAIIGISTLRSSLRQKKPSSKLLDLQNVTRGKKRSFKESSLTILQGKSSFKINNSPKKKRKTGRKNEVPISSKEESIPQIETPTIKFCSCGGRCDPKGLEFVCCDCKTILGAVIPCKGDPKLNYKFTLQDSTALLKAVLQHGRKWEEVLEICHQLHLMIDVKGTPGGLSKIENHFNYIKKTKGFWDLKEIPKIAISKNKKIKLSMLNEEEREKEIGRMESKIGDKTRAENKLRIEGKSYIDKILDKETKRSSRDVNTPDELLIKAWNSKDQKEKLRLEGRAIATSKAKMESNLNSIGTTRLGLQNQMIEQLSLLAPSIEMYYRLMSYKVAGDIVASGHGDRHEKIQAMMDTVKLMKRDCSPSSVKPKFNENSIEHISITESEEEVDDDF